MTLKFSYHTSNAPLKSSDVLDNLKSIIERKDIGFFHNEGIEDEISLMEKIYKKHEDKKYFIQVGIGGSALGPEFLIRSLKKNAERKFFFLDNIDSDYIHEVLSEIGDLKKSLFYVVSKSGGTAETISTLILVQNYLKEHGISESEFKNHFVFCTDPLKGDLRAYANEKGYDALNVPSNIGGRFSVQTSVGLFPALFAGVDIRKFIYGMNSFKEVLLKNNDDNPLVEATSRLLHLYKNEDVNQTVLMPYSSKLKTLSNWFVQLWGESLGKKRNDGTSVGLTPIASFGATDQHSQMQLFMEGPKDKCLFILEVESFSHNYSLSNSLTFESAKKFQGKSMNDLMRAELYGTLKALKEEGRNFIHLSIPSVDEASVGALILYFESLTALVGHYLEIDPFNQPGVEKGKIYSYEYLKS